ncbi:MAG: TraR/DksA C4-type zinc finger protein [Nitrospira sp.]|nr:hypothetical protein [Nitrospira sp.]
MRLIEKGSRTYRSHPGRQEVLSLRHALLRTRRMLLLHDAKRVALQLEQAAPADERGGVADDLLTQQASATLRQVERALHHMLEANYGLCRECRQDIQFSRLRRSPQATLCGTCIEQRLECLSADAL